MDDKEGEAKGGELKCYIHTSDEVGCRRAFAPKN